MWFPQCTSPGGLEPSQCPWTQGHCIFLPEREKKSSRRVSPLVFFFPPSAAVECVCAMYRSAVRQPFTILKWSRFLKGTIRKKQWSKLQKGCRNPGLQGCYPTGLFDPLVRQHLHLASHSPWRNHLSTWEDWKAIWITALKDWASKPLWLSINAQADWDGDNKKQTSFDVSLEQRMLNCWFYSPSNTPRCMMG